MIFNSFALLVLISVALSQPSGQRDSSFFAPNEATSGSEFDDMGIDANFQQPRNPQAASVNEESLMRQQNFQGFQDKMAQIMDENRFSPEIKGEINFASSIPIQIQPNRIRTQNLPVGVASNAGYGKTAIPEPVTPGYAQTARPAPVPVTSGYTLTARPAPEPVTSGYGQTAKPAPVPVTSGYGQTALPVPEPVTAGYSQLPQQIRSQIKASQSSGYQANRPTDLRAPSNVRKASTNVRSESAY